MQHSGKIPHFGLVKENGIEGINGVYHGGFEAESEWVGFGWKEGGSRGEGLRRGGGKEGLEGRTISWEERRGHWFCLPIFFLEFSTTPSLHQRPHSNWLTANWLATTVMSPRHLISPPCLYTSFFRASFE